MKSSHAMRWLGAVVFLLVSSFPGEAAVSPQPATLQSDPLLLQVYGGRMSAYAVQDQLAYIAIGPRLQVVDFSTPSRPYPRGQSELLGATIENLGVSGATAWLAAGEAGLIGVDASDPDRPQVISRLLEDQVVMDVALEAGRAYVASQSGLHVIDISLPAQPVQVGFFTTGWGFARLAVSGGIVCAHDMSYVYVIDVRDPNQPGLLQEYGWSGKAWGPGEIVMGGGFAYVYISGGYYNVIDLRDPAQIEVLAWDVLQGSSLALVDQRAYLSTYTAGVQILDVSNPVAPVLLGILDSEMSWLRLAGEYLYGVERGLAVAQVSDPATARLVGRYDLPPEGYLSDVERHLALRTTNQGLQVLEVSNPFFPHEISQYAGLLYGQAQWHGDLVLYQGARSYEPYIDEALHILDLSDPRQPALLADFPTDYGTYLIGSAGDYAYLGGYYLDSENVAQLTVLDISDPVQPSVAGEYSQAGRGYFPLVESGTAYLSIDEAPDYNDVGLYRLAVEDPTQIQVSGYYDGVQYLTEIAVVEPYVYVFEGETFEVLDWRSSYTPTVVLSGATDFLYGLTAGYESLYLATGWKQTLDIWDVRQPGNPQPVTTYRALGDFQEVRVEGPYVYLDNVGGGLGILWYAPPVTETVGTEGGSLYSPRDGVEYTFPAGTLTTTVTISHTLDMPGTSRPPNGSLAFAGLGFSGQGIPSEPQAAYTLTLPLDPALLGGAEAASVRLYRQEGGAWQAVPGSAVDLEEMRLTARPAEWGQFAIFGETNRVYLPMALRWDQ